MSHEYWEKKLTPVWISIPEPGKLDVYVYVYDRAGHKSELVEMTVLERKAKDIPRNQPTFRMQSGQPSL